jgi:hypothetical protein
MLDFLGRFNGGQVLPAENIRAPGVKARARSYMRSVVFCGRGQKTAGVAIEIFDCKRFYD